MRTRLLRHYYCDHCRVVKHTKPAMERHEKGCTANPDRVCKMCAMAGLTQKPLSELFLTQRGASFGDENDNYCPTSKEDELRAACGNCPACLLAVARQYTGAMPMSFDWKSESKKWLEIHGKKYAYDYV